MRCIGLILAGALAAGAAAQTGQSAAEYTRQFREFAASCQPPGENGDEILRRLVPRIDRLESSLRAEDCYFELLWADDDSDPATRERKLSRVREALAEARESGMIADLAALASSDNLLPPGLDEWAREQELDYLRPTRRLARFNGARFVLAIERGDQAEALAALRESLWLGRRTASFGRWHSSVSGQVSEKLALDLVRDQILAGRINAPLAASLLEVMEAAAPSPSVAMIYEGEQLLRRRDIANLYNDQGQMVRECLEAFRTRQFEPIHPLPATPGDPALPDLAQMLAWDEEFEAALPDIAAALPRDRQEVMDRFADDWNIYDTSTPAGEAHFLLFAAIVPGSWPTADLVDDLTLHQTGTRLMLAIEVYRARHGEPPTTLAALMPDILPEIPDDPYTHAPLFYEPDPDAPLGYTLYSAGYDATDDGGRPWNEAGHPTGHAYKALFRTGEGFDYVFAPAAPTAKDDQQR